MRDRETFEDLKEIGILYQYLWMDNKHTITINNGLADLTIRLTDNMSVVVKNHNYPEIEEQSYMSMLYPKNLIGIIDYLKHKYSDLTQDLSQWDIIKYTVAQSESLHYYNKR